METPEEFLAAVPEPRRAQLEALDQMIREVAPELEPYIEGKHLGYGAYPYKYASGRQGTWFRIGLGNLKNQMAMYFCVLDGDQYLAEKNAHRLGKASVGRSCIRFKRLEDLDLAVVREMIEQARTLKPMA